MGLLMGFSSCRVRHDVPEGPSAEPVVAPAASFIRRAEVRQSTPDGGIDASALLADAGEPPKGSFALALGGLEARASQPEPERRAARIALALLAQDRSPLDAAVAGTTSLEDAPTRNAGVGSSLRLDGQTVEMDAAVMTSDGRFGAVAALRRTRNPIRIARLVMDSPHRVLVGDGALRFARDQGFADFDPVTPAARAAHERALTSALEAWSADAGDAAVLPPGWHGYVEAFQRRSHDGGAAAPDAARPSAPSDAGPSDAGANQHIGDPPTDSGATDVAPLDTVFTLVRGADDSFAGAASSGGPLLALPGRAGDVPTPGAAMWVGPRGAVAVSGPGETLLDMALARSVYDRLVLVRSAKLAAAWGMKQVPEGTPVAIAVLDARGFAVEPKNAMAWAASEGTDIEVSKGDVP